jgi:hypothetical protein
LVERANSGELEWLDELPLSLSPTHAATMKALVVASEPVTGEQIRAALDEQDPSQLEVMVIAPALHESMLRFGCPMLRFGCPMLILDVRC